MNAIDLAWMIPSGLTLLGALLKISRQTGRIEEGVAGLYRDGRKQDERIDRLEDHVYRTTRVGRAR